MTAAPPRSVKIVLADDHTIVRQTLAETLSQHPDLEVVGEASNGLEALEMARRLRPDIVVMDVSMPRMSGLHATQRLTVEVPGVRVIGLSMHTSDDMARAMQMAGATAYLSKESSISALIEALRSATRPPGSRPT